MGFSIELMYFGTSDNVNDTFNYLLKSKKWGWREESRDEILRIAHQIKKNMYESHFEIAELKIKDHYNTLTLYL